MNALADPEVGKYLNDFFVSTFQKVGTFAVAGARKQGGNVASYFCTPGGRVLHAIPGPVDAATFLREVRWAVESYKLARLEYRNDLLRLKKFFGRAHRDRLVKEYGVSPKSSQRRDQLPRAAQVHQLLAAAPLVPIEKVYRVVFEQILREKISTAPVARTGF